jgi:hypothetical protein
MAGHLSNVIVYTGGYAFLVFIAVCLATGLYYLAEMVEAGPTPKGSHSSTSQLNLSHV